MKANNSVKQPKTSLKLPILLMTVPTILIIICFFFLYLIEINIINITPNNSNSMPADCTTPYTTLREASRCSPSVDGRKVLFGAKYFDLDLYHILNFVRNQSVIVFFPCLIAGLIILRKRLKARKKKL